MIVQKWLLSKYFLFTCPCPYNADRLVQISQKNINIRLGQVCIYGDTQNTNKLTEVKNWFYLCYVFQCYFTYGNVMNGEYLYFL